MALKVNTDASVGLAASQAAKIAQTQDEAAGRLRGTGSAAHDQVELSGLTSQIAKASSEFAAEQTSRVRGLSPLYASGRYVVDSRQVARSMVDHWLAGLGTTAKMEH